MNSSQMLNQYLDEHFPDLKLCPPLFYYAPIGIRFEMGDPEICLKKGYMKQVYHRSVTLFREVFSQNDEMFLVVAAHRKPHYTNKGKSINIRKYVKDKQILYKLGIIQLPYFFEGEDEKYAFLPTGLKTYLYSLKCKVSDVRYFEMLKAIANHDVGIKPMISEDCFFINTNKHIIFHLYDDRGADIIASSKDTLQNLYYEYNHWILDYDREQIDLTFKN